MNALIIGRYQPFHMGHLKLVKDIVQEFDGVIIGIGSAQSSHTLNDPFTAGERYMMIAQALAEHRIVSYYIVPIIDIHRYAVWVAHVEALTPRFDTVFTNNPLTKILFQERGYKVRESPLYERERYAGTTIRARMIAGEPWRELVPDAVAKLIDEVNGVERIKALAQVEQ
jgi:nicotinamide-nucleotide adenylyltransferase